MLRPRRPALSLAILLTAFATLAPLPAQGIGAMEFRDAPVREILLALARVSGRSIVPDATVSGDATFAFGATSLEAALAAFLPSVGLYSSERDGVISVSRMRLSWDGALLSADAEAVSASVLLPALAREAGLTLAADPLPDTSLSLHCRGLPPEEAAALVLRGPGGWRVERTGQALELRKLEAASSAKAAEGSGEGGRFERAADGTWSIRSSQARLGDLARSLLDQAGKDYALLMPAETPVPGLSFSGRGLEEALSLLMERAGGDWAEKGGITYLFELQRRDLPRSLRESEILQLSRIPAPDALALLPADLAAAGLCRVDRGANLVILSGSRSEIAPLRDFLLRLDALPAGLSARRFSTSALTAKEAIALLPPRLCPVAPQPCPDGWSFTALADDAAAASIAAFLAEADRADPPLPVLLSHLRAEDFLRDPPPSALKEELRASGRSDLVWFTGPASRREAFLRDLALVDKATGLIRYDVLILQSSARSSLEAKPALTGSGGGGGPAQALAGSAAAADPAQSGWAIAASLGQLMGIKFDVVSKLGAAFGAKLDASLGESSSRVCADTSLAALSGQEARIQNTSTYRYLDTEGSASGTASSVTREIASGIILSVTGFLTGSGEILLSVSATVSERAGGDSSGSASGPPETTERILSTKLRARPGEPVAITGLSLRKTERSRTKVPLLGDIPLLGLLFRGKEERGEDTTMSIYILPRLQGTAEDRSLEGLYRTVRGADQAEEGR